MYYGAADTGIAVATASVREMLGWLKGQGKSDLLPAKVPRLLAKPDGFHKTGSLSLSFAVSLYIMRNRISIKGKWSSMSVLSITDHWILTKLILKMVTSVCMIGNELSMSNARR